MMGAVISVIDWCLGRDEHHHIIQQLEDKLLEYECKIEKMFYIYIYIYI